MEGNGFGYEHYVYTPDAPLRQRTVFARTIRPSDRERNCDFERRMDDLAMMLVKQHGAVRVDLDMRRQDGAIVECLVAVAYEPRVEPITHDTRLAGGRVVGRGARS
jgi:hypothetical protein